MSFLSRFKLTIDAQAVKISTARPSSLLRPRYPAAVFAAGGNP
jgi:hypothetical protein